MIFRPYASSHWSFVDRLLTCSSLVFITFKTEFCRKKQNCNCYSYSYRSYDIHNKIEILQHRLSVNWWTATAVAIMCFGDSCSCHIQAWLLQCTLCGAALGQPRNNKWFWMQLPICCWIDQDPIMQLLHYGSYTGFQLHSSLRCWFESLYKVLVPAIWRTS